MPISVICGGRALDRHHALFGRARHLAAGDRGFSSAANEQTATDRACEASCSPGAGRNPQADGPTNGTRGSGAANGGGSAVKGA